MTSADVSARVAWSEDAPAIAAVQVRAWRTMYAELLPAEVLEALDADDITAVVDIQLRVGSTMLTARITRESLQRLHLVRGQPVYALVKAVAFDRRSVGYA